MSNTRVYTQEDITRLTQLVDEGVQVLQEIEDLKAGLSDTVKAIGEEVDIAPSQLNKVIKSAHKRNLTKQKDALGEVEEILQAIKRV